jgi:NifB/MoaA-like Fe-S oxidoreductase
MGGTVCNRNDTTQFVEYQPDVKRITGEGGVIGRIIPGSIAEELGLQPGATVLMVGDLRLRDVIDYRFAIADEQIELLVRGPEGEVIYEIEKDPDEDLGIEFVEPLFDRLRTCNNKCPFCFLTQMPKGMRKTLYLKDDDYRLSFLYNNFVTLTNLSEDDWLRIERQRLSPLHISVHGTDQALRAVMLGKPDVPDVLAQIRRLSDAGITVHTQVVACPGVNDGAALHRTVQDLAALYPVVQSIAVVPVGLTKFRFDGKRPQSIRTAIQVHETPEWINSNWERQPLWMEETNGASPPLHDPSMGFCARLGAATDVPLRCYTPAEAGQVIDLLSPYSARYQHTLGLHLVYPSDEFYILANRDLPAAEFYDGMPQYSNGVGMARDFLDLWAREQRRLPARLPRPVTLAIVCGTLIAPIMQRVVDRLNRIGGLEVRLLPVSNQFFGETVTVSGLLMGQDVVPVLRESACNRAILPRVMFDYQGERTLDEYTPQRIAAEAGLPVAIAGDPVELVRSIKALRHDPEM